MEKWHHEDISNKIDKIYWKGVKRDEDNLEKKKKSGGKNIAKSNNENDLDASQLFNHQWIQEGKNCTLIILNWLC